MSDDSSGLTIRQSRPKRTADRRVAEFTMMVRVPGRPLMVGVYTDAERAEAAQYAAEVGGEVIPLPLSLPAGYTADPSGLPIPLTP